MVDTVIQLGNFKFKDLEVPESINCGGAQSIAVHKLVGGQRIINALGPDDDDLIWGGLMTGPDALQRATQLDQMRIAGKTLDLSFFSLKYQVLIAKFAFRTERYYQVRYEITVKIVTNYNISNTNNNVINFTSQVNTDANTLLSLSTSIDDPNVTEQISGVVQDILTIPSIEQASMQDKNALTTKIVNSIIFNNNNIADLEEGFNS
jgi:hypothetical protein